MTHYVAAKGSTLTDAQAQLYGERIESICENKSGPVTAEDVLQDAQSKSSPLHEYFTWDMKEAARKRWLDEARELLRFIHVTTIVNGQEFSTRAFLNITIVQKEKEESGYLTLENVMLNADLRMQIINRAIKELEWWRKRYETYAEFGDIVAAIEATEQQLIPMAV